MSDGDEEMGPSHSTPSTHAFDFDFEVNGMWYEDERQRGHTRH